MASTTYSVTRSRSIAAPADRVYPLIADFHQWTRWSPWEDADPELHRAYSGNGEGAGAVYAWAGNRKAGSGRMEILATEPNTSVEIALEFQKPFKSSNRITFTLTPQGEGATEVTWRMEGPRPLPMRLFGFLFNMEKLVGGDFEKGLNRLAMTATHS
jgi:uncharacterized protein YndB with AHSA1/START domain